MLTCITHCTPPTLEFLCLRTIVQVLLDYPDEEEDTYLAEIENLTFSYPLTLLRAGLNDLHFTYFIVRFFEIETGNVDQVLKESNLLSYEIQAIDMLTEQCKTNPPEQVYLQMVRENNLLAVKILLLAGIPVDTQDKHHQTALLLASLKGHVDMARMLISWGAQLDAQNDFGYTPLLEASMSRHLDCVRLLLDAGANPRIKSYHGLSLFDIKAKRDQYALQLMLAPYEKKPNWITQLINSIFYRLPD